MTKIQRMVLLIMLLFTLGSSFKIDNFSWDNYNGTSFITDVRNQNFPAACNSGWALSAVDLINSRIKIDRNAQSPDVSISAQVLLSCDNYDYGCLGGEPLSAFRWIIANNITDESCHSYTAKGYTNGYGCSSIAKCQSCSNNTCKSVPNSKIYALNDYGTIGGVQNMKQQISSYGPIVCGINSNSLHQYTSGIINQNSNSSRVNHFVLIYGWGTQNNVDFWRVKNSWGPAWGQSGHFRIQMGKNYLQIQQRCYWANLKDTWTQDIRNNTVPNTLKVFTTLQNVPINLLPSRNYRSPNSCEASTAFSIVQMIADRQSILTAGKQKTILSAQALLNCGVGKCSKQATPNDILVFIEKYGLPEQGCQTYQGKDPQRDSCLVSDNCATCEGSVYSYKCQGISNYKRWKIRDHGTVIGVTAMKNQLVSGPIVCGIEKTKAFENYSGGIFSEITISPKINYYVEVVGVGKQNNKQFWLGRTMWGTYWGQSSFFRVQVGKNTIGIQSKCYYSKNLL